METHSNLGRAAVCARAGTQRMAVMVKATFARCFVCGVVFGLSCINHTALSHSPPQKTGVRLPEKLVGKTKLICLPGDDLTTPSSRCLRPAHLRFPAELLRRTPPPGPGEQVTVTRPNGGTLLNKSSEMCRPDRECMVGHPFINKANGGPPGNL